jgi:hypothetical protein
MSEKPGAAGVCAWEAGVPFPLLSSGAEKIIDWPGLINVWEWTGKTAADIAATARHLVKLVKQKSIFSLAI